MSDKPSDEIQQDQNQIRHSLVSTAVNFLLNPNVIDKANEHKTAFLKKKGLTDAEINLAFERFDRENKSKQFLSNYGMNNPPNIPPSVPLYGAAPVSFWSRLSRFSSSLIKLGVALFGAHYVYKNYIEPLLFGDVRDDKSRRLEKQLQEMINSLSLLQVKICDLEENVKGQKDQIDKIVQNEVNEYYPTPLALRELKSEIASVKSLMLNRHQFPALPKVTSPTIPQWQLPPKENESDITGQNNDDTSKTPNIDEITTVPKTSTDVSSEDSDSIEFINGKTSETAESVNNESSEALNDGLSAS